MFGAADGGVCAGCLCVPRVLDIYGFPAVPKSVDVIYLLSGVVGLDSGCKYGMLYAGPKETKGTDGSIRKQKVMTEA